MRRILHGTLAALPWLLLLLLPWPSVVSAPRRLVASAVLEATGRLEEAEEAYRGLDRDGVPGARAYLAATLRTHAAREFWAGRHEEACQALEECLRLEPLRLHPRLLLGLAKQKRGLEQEALKAFERVTRDFPDNPEGLVAAGHLHWINGRREIAEERYREALERAPASGLIRVEIGEARLWAGEDEEGAWLLREAVGMEADCAVCRLHLARFLAARGHAEEARGHARAALGINPAYAEARAFLEGGTGPAPAVPRSELSHSKILFESFRPEAIP